MAGAAKFQTQTNERHEPNFEPAEVKLDCPQKLQQKGRRTQQPSDRRPSNNRTTPNFGDFLLLRFADRNQCRKDGAWYVSHRLMRCVRYVRASLQFDRIMHKPSKPRCNGFIHAACINQSINSWALFAKSQHTWPRQMSWMVVTLQLKSAHS